jgi:hypothetical protein
MRASLMPEARLIQDASTTAILSLQVQPLYVTHRASKCTAWRDGMYIILLDFLSDNPSAFSFADVLPMDS